MSDLHSQTGSMAQAAADPLAVASTWIDVLTLASEKQKQANRSTFWTHTLKNIKELMSFSRHVLVQFERANLLQHAEEHENLTWEKLIFCADTGLSMHKKRHDGLGMEWSGVVIF